MSHISTPLRRSLISASILALSAGAASAATPIKLSVGGFFTQSFAFVTADAPNDPAPEPDFEDTALNQNAEVHFKGRTTLDNGTEIGFQVQLEAESRDDIIDEHYIYARGAWGRLIVGAENGVAHLGEATGPSFVPGLRAYNNSVTDAVIEDAYDIAFGKVRNLKSASLMERLTEDDMGNPIFEEASSEYTEGLIEDAHMSTKLEHISGDANKISYFSPRIVGLQFGLSFAPNNEDRTGGESNFVDTATANQTDIFEASLNFSFKLGGQGLKTALTGISASNTDEANEDNPSGLGFGLVYTFGDGQIGVNNTTYTNLRSTSYKYAESAEISTTYAGFSYKFGRTKIGLGFTTSTETLERDRLDANGDPVMQDGNPVIDEGETTYTEIMLGGGTRLAPRVEVGYYLQQTSADYDAPDALNNTIGKSVTLVGATLALRF